MRIPRIAHFVNEMTNIGYLSGFVRRLDRIEEDVWHKKQLGPEFHGFLLQQNDNLQQAIPIHVPKGVPLPPEFMGITVAVHLFGETDPVTGQQTIRVYSLDMARPSTRAMPVYTVWVNKSNRKYADKSFLPFDQDGRLTEEAKANTEGEDFKGFEAVMQTILELSRGRRELRYGYNSNVVEIAGFVHSVRSVTPGPDNFIQNPHYEILLRQHADKSKCLPVRLYTNNMRSFKNKIIRLAPYVVTGKVMVKVTPGEDGGVKHAHLYVRTEDISAAAPGRDILSVPEWYHEERMLLKQENERRRQTAHLVADAEPSAFARAA